MDNTLAVAVQPDASFVAERPESPVTAFAGPPHATALQVDELDRAVGCREHDPLPAPGKRRYVDRRALDPQHPVTLCINVLPAQVSSVGHMRQPPVA